MKNCLECQVEFKPYDDRAKYCSRSCAAKKNNKARAKIKKCLYCSGDVGKAGVKYCSMKCSGGHRNQMVINKWINDPASTNTKHGMSATISFYLKEQAGWKCQSPNCYVPGGWGEIHPITGKVPVELNHIDGDAYNNHPDNLIVLCPNCHALTDNYRALNKKGTRVHR